MNLAQPAKTRTYWIGLTGGAASGKSTVAQWFRNHGAFVIDADQIARKLRAPGGGAFDQILAEFGTTDSRALRNLVFGNSPEKVAARQRLQAILHPKILAESERIVQASGASWVLYEGSLLVETKRYLSLDALVAVAASDSVRIERLVRRDNLSHAQAQELIASQISDRERTSVATWTIDNSGSLRELEIACEKLNEKIQSELAKSEPFQRHS
jgi:dephospho-CoA kinase